MVITWIPPLDDFHPQNPFWNGYSKLADMNVEIVESAVQARNCSALIITAPDIPYTEDELDAIRAMAKGGTTMLVLEDYGRGGNMILSSLGVPIRFTGDTIADPIMKDKNSKLPIAIEKGGRRIWLDYATRLEILGPGPRILASTTNYSYIDNDRDGLPDDPSQHGPYPIAAEYGMGKGKIIVVADSSIFINSILDKNRWILSNYTKLCLDVGHRRSSTMTAFRDSILAPLADPMMKGMVTLLAAIAVLYIVSRAIPGKR